MFDYLLRPAAVQLLGAENSIVNHRAAEPVPRFNKPGKIQRIFRGMVMPIHRQHRSGNVHQRTEYQRSQTKGSQPAHLLGNPLAEACILHTYLNGKRSAVGLIHLKQTG